MKEVEKKDLPEIPGGVQPPYPGGNDVGPFRGPRVPELEEYPPAPQSPIFG
jgi:hypothetical protein